MKCKVCGQELPERAKFCFACGAPLEDVPAPKKLEEPLDPALAGGAVPMVPVAPPPRATRVEPRAVRVRAARAVHPGSAQGGLERRFRESALDTDFFPEQDLVGAREPWEDGEKNVAPAAEPAAAAAGDAGAGDADATAAVPVRRVRHAAAVEPEAEPAPDAAPALAAEPAPRPAPARPKPAPAVGPRRERAAAAATEAFAEARDGMGNAVRSAFGGLPEVKGRAPRISLIAAFAVAAVVVVALIAFVSTSWLGPLAPLAEPAPEVQPPSDGSIAPLTQEDSEDEAPAEDDALPEGAPEVRAAVDDYSWEELSQIADLIANAETDDEATDLAAEYNLCATDGSLDGTQAKDLELSDGTTVSMRVAGFRQDERADGEGVAGITFIAAEPVAEMAMCPNAEKGSGWRDTTLRAWMNEELLAELPEELSGVIVSVSKATNPVVGTGSSQIVTEDVLWVPSYSELTGTVRDGMEQEGEQYQLFADLGVDSGGASEGLALGDAYWWERSPDQSNEAWFMCVGPDGTAATSHRPATPNGVVPGFCL